MKALLLILGAGGLYWAYRNGWGAIVGVCPTGYQVVQDMFPTCRNSAVVASDTTVVAGRPTTSLPFPWVWAPNGTGQWVPVTENAQWPAPPAPTGLSGYRRLNYRRRGA